jgi:hypothetical protein
MNQIVNALRWLWKQLKSFGLFWKDFLIGDDPEFAIGAVLIMGLVFIVRSSRLLASILTPAAVVILLSIGIRVGKRR